MPDLDEKDPRSPSKQISDVQKQFGLIADDLRKFDNEIRKLEDLLSIALDFEQFQRRKIRAIDNLRRLAHRPKNACLHINKSLDKVYHHVTELEEIVGETHESINSRFTFHLHEMRSDLNSESIELATFAEFVDLFRSEKIGYSYFLIPFGSTKIFLCQYMPINEILEIFDFQITIRAEEPFGIFSFAKRWWRRRFGDASLKTYHLFSADLVRSDGVLQKKSIDKAERHSPFRADQISQIPKILYDFINSHGISDRRHVNLIKRDDRSAIFISRRPPYFLRNRIILTAEDRPENLQLIIQ